ncbi:ATP-binding protein [Desulfamplus magnetovallimortis]|nr:ATP-binding protein [Desulfamplus magnetovallimortis]
MKLKFGIRKKFLTGFLLLSLLPLTALSFFTRNRMDVVFNTLVQRSRNALTENSMSLLEARAQAIADQVEQLLAACVDDLKMLISLPADPSIYMNFANVHKRDIWYQHKTSPSGHHIRETLPLYCEVVFVNSQGIEEIRIADGKPVFLHHDSAKRPHLQDSLKIKTKFGNEDFFQMAMAAKENDIYVSHLTGYHVTKDNYFSTTTSDSENNKNQNLNDYRGIIRFAGKKMVKGVCKGVVSIALDHRHLMEFTQHILPFGNQEVVAPIYESGNYAFMFDDEGWMITHPKQWDIRGTFPDGEMVDPSSSIYNEKNLKAGLFPFNLLHVPFIHENYGHIARDVIAGKSGVVKTTSVKGVPRILAYAPINFSYGLYSKHKCFGGVTLGARSEEFHRTVDQTSAEIDLMVKKASENSIILIFATGALVAAIALFLARSFTRPIVQLTEKVNEISSGYYDISIEIKSGDELEILGKQFTEMGSRLKLHQQNLVRSLDELKQNVDLLRRIHAGMLSSLIVFNRDGKILSANPRAAHFFNQLCKESGVTDHNLNNENFSRKELAGQNIKALLAPYPELMAHITKELDGHDSPVNEQKNHLGAQNNQPHGESFKVNMPDGKLVYLETSISTIPGNVDSQEKDNMEIPEKGNKGKFNPQNMDRGDHSTLLIFRDVTRRKNMEKHISRSDKLVSLGILAAGIAHEIRNPLTGITLMLDDLHDRIANRTNDRLLIQRALEEIEKLENIVTRLLEFASKPAHDPVLEDLNKVVADTLFFVKKQCKQKGVTLISRTNQNLPRILIDRERIRQAILNIVLNALNVLEDSMADSNGNNKDKNRNKGKIVISTDITDISEDHMVLLSIKDNGPGIAREDLDAIFDPFFSHNPDGFGLGLSITHTIVEEHGGRIVVESEPGKGACFNIHLPI